MISDDDVRRGEEAFDESGVEGILAGLRAGAVKGQAFREMKITPRRRLLDDWFREGDTGFLFSRRGTGKTWLAWAIARAIARGEGFGPWSPGEEAAQVCYLDGEMPAELMQDRDKAFGGVCENLTLINHEILFEQTSLVLNLADPKVQRAITQWCVEVGCKVLVIDNLSTLISGVKENDADAWEALLTWLLDLRRRKIAVLLIHHAGRSGEMRGTSRREDSVFWILKLEEQIDYDGLGCSFLVRFDKNRNSALNSSDYVWTFEPSTNGEIKISWRAATLEARVLSAITDGICHCKQIAHELGCSPGAVSKAAKKLEAAGKIGIAGRKYSLIGGGIDVDL
jgi:AAA domain